ncbi:hypothetical protein GCM10023147_40620 [Tsukamurella soli]|uniref:Ig-like domain-containing protein n=1 Tax=Tsukamurella soli TaxID=644556 RepID=A0ABP8K7G5_9ACTN
MPRSSATGIPALAGIWRGSYTCNQGRTGLTLTIAAGSASAGTATFAFAPLPDGPTVPDGSYSMSVTRSHGGVEFLPVAWIQHPSAWTMVGLTVPGPVNWSGSELTGSVDYAGCSTFTVTRSVQ